MLYMLFTCFKSKCVTRRRTRPRVTRLRALPAEAGKKEYSGSTLKKGFTSCLRHGYTMGIVSVVVVAVKKSFV